MSTDNNKKEHNGNEIVMGGSPSKEKILKTTSVENSSKKEVKEEITLTKDNEESKMNNIDIIEIKENKEEKKKEKEKEKTETVTNVKEDTFLKDGNEEEVSSLTFAEASQVMKFLASAVPSEDFKNNIKDKLAADENSELLDIFDSEGNIKIKALEKNIPEAAEKFFNASNEGKKILRAINVLKIIFLALSDKSVKFGNNGLGKNLLSILKGWGVENKPNDKTVIEVSKILASIKSMGGSKLLGDEFKSPEKNSKNYEGMVKEYNITEQQLESDDNFVSIFITQNKALGRLLCEKLSFSEDQKSQILENAIVDQSLNEETLDKAVGILSTIPKSIQKISNVVKDEILSKKEELDEKTTSKDRVWSGAYNKVFSSYSVSAKTLQKIVSKDGAITFNVFLINDEEFKVAMKAFEDIYQKSSDVAFGNLLKTIKVLRICANQKDNQMAKKFKGYVEEHKQTTISTLFSSNFLLNFIPEDELKDSANSNILEANFGAARLFFSKFELSKEDVEDIENLVLIKEDKKDNEKGENKETTISETEGSVYSDTQSRIGENENTDLTMKNKLSNENEINKTNTNILEKRSHGDLRTGYRLSGIDQLRNDQEMDLRSLNSKELNDYFEEMEENKNKDESEKDDKKKEDKKKEKIEETIKKRKTAKREVIELTNTEV